MLAGRPHEAVGNGSPRWMAVGPRKRVHRTRPTGQLARRPLLYLRLHAHEIVRGRISAHASADANIASSASRPKVTGIREQVAVIIRLGNGRVAPRYPGDR